MSVYDRLRGKMRYDCNRQQRTTKNFNQKKMAGSGLCFKKYFQQASTNVW